MSVAAVTRFLSLLGLLANLGVLVVAAGAAVPSWRRSVLAARVRDNALELAALIAVVATLGSLYLSEVAHFTPCTLCWWQRYGMYPLALILPVAAVLRRPRVRRWVWPLIVWGLPVAVYHYTLEWFPRLETGVCTDAVPCSAVWFREFGFVTIPYLSASAFLGIAVLLAIARRRDAAGPPTEDDREQRREGSDVAVPGPADGRSGRPAGAGGRADQHR